MALLQNNWTICWCLMGRQSLFVDSFVPYVSFWWHHSFVIIKIVLSQNSKTIIQLWALSKIKYTHEGTITWSIFNPRVELSPVYWVEISVLSVIQNSIKIKHTITWQNIQPRAEFNPGIEISTLLQLAQFCHVIVSTQGWNYHDLFEHAW
jgi:hypothetical protein